MASRLWATRAASFLRISVPHRGFATVLKDLKYSNCHGWVRTEGNLATVGITDRAQEHMRELVHVDLFAYGCQVKQNKAFGAIESLNKSSLIYSPVSGKVVQVNTKLKKFPRLVNESPYEIGWILKVEMKDSNELNNLMDSDQYSKFCETALRPRSFLDRLFNRK
ncbi:NAD-dependent glutamate dehydrogenase [Castilleja foliolosa]|uniref:Glycine cleavage system H protein n=1 Tax=Castilleja foliolosa TaxID=1961234 RepID=A0ABD3C3U4_9LAMI